MNFACLAALLCLGMAVEGQSVDLPLVFEHHPGQAGSPTRFVGRGPAYSIAVMGAENLLALPNGVRPVRIRARGGAASVPEAMGEPSCVANSITGANPAEWTRGVPCYERVRVRGVYPGIDWVFRSGLRRLEYDFVVSPESDPSVIELEFDGVDGAEVTPGGELLLRTDAGVLLQPRPVAYQETSAGRSLVGGEYEVRGRNRVGFCLGSYDRRRTLVIDPVLEFTSHFGGSGHEKAHGVAVDGQGNIYVGGYTGSADFATASPYQGSYGGDPNDIFAMKLDPSGTKVLYATYIGGNNRDECKCFTVDAAGNAYISGRTKSPDFPTTEGAFHRTLAATYDICLVKLSPEGDRLVYSAIFGGESMEEARGIAVDREGNCTVVGGTHSPDFPMTASSFRPQYTDPPEPDPEKKTGAAFQNEDAFVVKVNPTGTAMVFGTFLGGHGLDKAWGCSTDSEGNVYVTGHAGAHDFPTTEGAFQREHCGGENDAFVTKLSPGGDRVLFSTLLGGSGTDVGHGIDVGADGRVYVGVSTESRDMASRDPQQAGFGGGKSDAYFAVLSRDFGKLLYGSYLGGSGDDSVASDGLAAGAKGLVAFTGDTSSADFPESHRVDAGPGGGTDAYVACFDTGARRYAYVSRLGGQGDDSGAGVAVDARGRVLVTGQTGSADFPVRGGAPAPSAPSGGNAFVAVVSAP